MSALRLMTWNLNGLDPADLDVRTEAACLAMLLRPDQPDVVLLQEVVRRSWHAHLKHHFAAAGFTPVPPEPPLASGSEYFCAVLIKKARKILRHGNQPFPNTEMGRALVWAEIEWDGATLLVSTSHLESGRDASRERTEQLRVVVEGLIRHEGPAVFGGDTNLRVAEEPKVPRLDEVADAWTAAGADAALRATWPSVPRGGRPGARFDRILVSGCRVDHFAVTGHQAPGFPHPPSDHLAVEVVVER